MSNTNLLTPTIKRKVQNRLSSGSSSDSPEEKRLKEFNEDEGDEGDNSVEVFHKWDDMEKLVEKIERISMKLEVLDEIERKVSKLDSIEEKLERFSSRLTEIEKIVASLRCELKSSKEKQAELQRSVDEVKDSLDAAHGRSDTLELKSYKLDSALKEAKEDLGKKILYLETYSRRENLKFAGIPEGRDEQEDTKEVLVEFLSKQLEIERAGEIEFQRVHRMGKKGGRPRMIIARFLRYVDRERVMRNAFKLKNTDFTIYDDIPKELIDLRKKHMTIFREARKAGKKAVFSKSEPDKLFIDGKLVA